MTKEEKSYIKESLNRLLYVIEELARDRNYYLLEQTKKLRSDMYKWFSI